MAETRDAGLQARLDRIRALTDQLMKTQDDSTSCRELAVKILAEVDAARAALEPIQTAFDVKPR